MFSFHLSLGDISCQSGRWKAGGEQWNALSCLPLTQPPAEFTQRVILEACGACGRPPGGCGSPPVSGNWKQIAGWAGSSQVASPGSCPGTPGGCLGTPGRQRLWSPGDDVGLSPAGLGHLVVPCPPSCLLYVLMLMFVAEAALWDGGEQPLEGSDWNRRSVVGEPGAVNLISDPWSLASSLSCSGSRVLLCNTKRGEEPHRVTLRKRGGGVFPRRGGGARTGQGEKCREHLIQQLLTLTAQPRLLGVKIPVPRLPPEGAGVRGLGSERGMRTPSLGNARQSQLEGPSQLFAA